MKSLRRSHFATFLLLLPSLLSSCSKPAEKPQFYKMTGTVVSVELRSHQATIQHGAIPGFMDAMTMPYKVDKPDVFKKVKVGDQIKATVYEGDYTLYNVEVLPASNSKK